MLSKLKARRYLSLIVAVFIFIGGNSFMSTDSYAATEINVLAYGAVSDDAYDDGYAIRAAIDSAIEQNGVATNVNFGSGTYRVGPPPKSWDFASNLEGWTATNSMAIVNSSIVTLTPSSSDPYLTSPDHLMMRNVETIAIKMKNSTSSTTAKLQWITQTDRTWDENKSVSVTITANDPNYSTYYFSLVGNQYAGSKTIRQLRVHVEEGISSGTVFVDSIKVAPYPSPNYTFTNSLQGWTAAGSSTLTAGATAATITVTGATPAIASPAQLNLAGGVAASIKVVMKNSTAATQAKIKFTTNKDGVFGGTKERTFAINPNDSNFTTYNVYMGYLPEYTGKDVAISQLKLEIEGVSSGTVYLDSFSWDQQDVEKGIYVASLIDASNVTLKGTITDGAPATTLLVTDPMTGLFWIQNCTSTTVQGFTVDYETHPFSQGTITAIDRTGAGSFDFQPDPGYEAILEDSRYVNNPGLLGFGCARDSSNPYLIKKGGVSNINWSGMTKINSTTWHFTTCYAGSMDSPLMDVGDKFVISPRGSNAEVITIYGNTNSTIDTVNVYASPEAVIIGDGENGSVSIKNFKVQRKPGSTRWISSNADGLHFHNFKQGTVVENSLFEGSTDDGANYYTRPSILNNVNSTTNIRVWRGMVPLPSVGDTIQVYNGRDGKIVGTSTVTAVNAVGSYNVKDVCDLVLSSPIEGMTGGNTFATADYIFNLSRGHSGFEFRNSTFRDNRGNGIRTKGRNGLITGCTFTDIEGSAIEIGALFENGPENPYYLEGPIPDNITISNCVITDNVYHTLLSEFYGVQSASIKIQGRSNHGFSADPIVSRITIQDTVINHNQSQSSISATGVNDLTVSNVDINNDSGDQVWEDMCSIRLENTKNVKIGGGTRILDIRPELDAGILAGYNALPLIETYNAIVAPGVPAIKKFYLASEDFSGSQGPTTENRWMYSEWNGSALSNMIWNSGDNSWIGSAPWSRIWSYYQHPDTTDSVRRWAAPSLGGVIVNGGVALMGSGGDGVIAKLAKNSPSNPLWTSAVTSTTPIYPTGVSWVNVLQNEEIQFIVNKNGNNYYDATSWDPQIEFWGIPGKYGTPQWMASEGFAGAQFENYWTYETYNGSFSAMNNFESSTYFWNNGNDQWNRVYDTYQHPGENTDSVRTWTAPYSGTVSITGEISVPDVNSDGVLVNIFKNTTSQWQAVIPGGGSTTPTGVGSIAVNAGDVIRFKVNKYGNHYNDVTSWNPVITYN